MLKLLLLRGNFCEKGQKVQGLPWKAPLPPHPGQSCGYSEVSLLSWCFQLFSRDLVFNMLSSKACYLAWNICLLIEDTVVAWLPLRLSVYVCVMKGQRVSSPCSPCARQELTNPALPEKTFQWLFACPSPPPPSPGQGGVQQRPWPCRIGSHSKSFLI